MSTARRRIGSVTASAVSAFALLFLAPVVVSAATLDVVSTVFLGGLAFGAISLLAGAHAIQDGRIEVLGGDMASPSHRRATCPFILRIAVRRAIVTLRRGTAKKRPAV